MAVRDRFPSVFMDVHDIDEEEEITRKAVARGEYDTDFDRRWMPKTNEGEEGAPQNQFADTRWAWAATFRPNLPNIVPLCPKFLP